MKPLTSIIKLSKSQQHQPKKSIDAGFTLVELLIVIIIIGVLSVLAGGGLLGWMQRLRVTAARDEVYGALRDAQSRARQQNDSWKVSVRENNNRVEWAVHPATATPSIWKPIEQRDVIINGSNTTPTGTPWEVEFDNKGLVVGALGKITLSGNSGGYQRCVRIKTLLGAMSTEADDNCRR